VAVLNTVLSNTGDAAIYQAITTSLEDFYPGEVEIIALDNLAASTRILYPTWSIAQQPTVSPARWRLPRKVLGLCRRLLVKLATSAPWARAALVSRAGRLTEFGKSLYAIASADIVLSSGGTYLVDHYDFSHRVDEIEFARRSGNPVTLWTQSMGPFRSTRAKSLIERAAPNVTAVYFRDEKSRRAWEAATLSPARNAVVPDCVFGLSVPALQPGATGGRVEPVRKPLALLSVRSWHQGVEGGAFDFHQYGDGMREVARRLIERGWRCVAVSTCQGVASYRIDDSATAARIFAGLDVEVDTAFHSPDELVSVIAEADLVVATRMHFAILSLISGKPVHAIAYESKTTELFNGLGFPDAVTSIENVSTAWATQLMAPPDPAIRAAQLGSSQIEELRLSATRPAREIVRSRLATTR